MSRVCPTSTPNGPMWEMFSLIHNLDTRCSRTIPPGTKFDGNGLVHRLLRLLAHEKLDKNPSEIFRSDDTLYLGPRAAHILVDLIVADKGTSARARTLQAQFHARLSVPVPPRIVASSTEIKPETIDDAIPVTLTTGTVLYTRFGNDFLVHLHDLTTVLSDESLGEMVTPNEKRYLSFRGETSPWVSLDTAVRILSTTENTLEREILTDIFGEIRRQNSSEPDTAPLTLFAIPALKDDDSNVKELNVSAYVRTLCGDIIAQRVLYIILKNDGISRTDIYRKSTRQVRHRLDTVLSSLLDSKLIYRNGSLFHAVKEHHGVRVAG